jgi:glycosyltransferase involved in cell wall biosynthesis
VPSPDIEIIVSENYGADNGLLIAQSFQDPRLSVCRPPRPLPMHENWEFLLNKAKGRWITFLGDDDAVMPYCADYISYIGAKYPEAEAVVSPRAYFNWESADYLGSPVYCSYKLRHLEMWCDSKREFRKCLSNQITYQALPQMYSGGFHRRSLVQRVLRAQNGFYFRSATPDAYTALMAVLHTYRYLEVGVPLSWVGSSPPHGYGGKIDTAKDKYKDFFLMAPASSQLLNDTLGNGYRHWPLLLFFFEACISAAPFVGLDMLSGSYIKVVYIKCAVEMIARGRGRAAVNLAGQLGVPRICYLFALVKHFFAQVLQLFCSALHRLLVLLPRKLAGSPKVSGFVVNDVSTGSLPQIPDILTVSRRAAAMYRDHCALHDIPTKF